MGALDHLVRDIKDSFWSHIFYEDGKNRESNGIVAACSRVVGERIKGAKDIPKAVKLLEELAKRRMPLDLGMVDVEQQLSLPDWPEFFRDVIEASLVTFIRRTDQALREEDIRREAMYPRRKNGR